MENMENMTEKEFSKLKRRDLLELLLSQIQEDDRLERRGAAMAARITKQEKSLAHLKERLDEKDAQIERLKHRLDEKDKQIVVLRDTLQRERTSRRIELEEAGSIAEAALKLSGIFEAAQDAADRYLENVKLNAMESIQREAQEAGDSEPPDETRELDEPEEAQESKASQELKESQEPRELPEAKDSAQAAEAKAPKASESFDRKEAQESQEAPDELEPENPPENFPEEVMADGEGR